LPYPGIIDSAAQLGGGVLDRPTVGEDEPHELRDSAVDGCETNGHTDDSDREEEAGRHPTVMNRNWLALC
jgi:hypothetical protein